MDEITKTVNSFKDADDFSGMKSYLKKMLKRNEYDHWVLAQLGWACHNLYEYDESLKYSEAAYNEAPDCPVVLELRGVALYMTKHVSESIKILNKLLNMNFDDIAYGECGEGKSFAQSLLNDVKVRLALCNIENKNFASAEEYLIDHLNCRRRGLYSDFSKKYIQKKIDSLI